ncbi:Alpha/Beta hydrolase protein [Crucibulum laeve]|uniref:Alpha/Beta hydrolase protein n=1 Tax=Crucibulum laeve TaxID=68775 RepID=A0A5C3M162_9AGAR|nr:Alpha/Beta hydrolase protein [Crucibulum laeve]
MAAFQTLQYKSLKDGTPVLLDIYPPTRVSNNSATVPAVVYFHGGALIVGNRRDGIPTWLLSRVAALGYAFISADYRLIPPSNAHAILEDVQDLHAFLPSIEVTVPSEDDVDSKAQKVKIDTEALAVAGSSSGAFLAFLAAMHWKSKPKAVLSIYGMSGDFLMPLYLTPSPMAANFDKPELKDFVYPFPSGPLKEVADWSLTHIPAGHSSNPRSGLPPLYTLSGKYLDYFTGDHEPSFSRVVEEAYKVYAETKENGIVDPTSESFVEAFKAAIPEHHIPLFPQLGVTSSWPPAVLLHGNADIMVPFQESKTMAGLLNNAGVPVKFIEFEGKDHLFDYDPTAEATYTKEFDAVGEFLKKYIESILNTPEN